MVYTKFYESIYLIELLSCTLFDEGVTITRFWMKFVGMHMAMFSYAGKSDYHKQYELKYSYVQRNVLCYINNNINTRYSVQFKVHPVQT